MRKFYFTLKNKKTGLECYKTVAAVSQKAAELLVDRWFPAYTVVSVKEL